MATDLTRRTAATSVTEPAASIRAPAAVMGFWAAVAAAALTAVFVVLAVVYTADEWRGMEAYAEAFKLIQVAQLVPILLLAPVAVVLMACIDHTAHVSRRVFSHIALAFSVVYAAIIATNYIVQLFVVRLNVLAGDLEGLALLAMPNPRSVFVGLETAGYGFFSLMALCAGAAFAGSRVERWVRRSLFATGVTGLAGTIAALADQRLLMLAGFGLSLLAFLAAAVLLGIHFRADSTQGRRRNDDPRPVMTQPEERAETMATRRIAQATLHALTAVPLFATAPLYRRWHQRWGATDAEVVGRMPGDEIVPETSFNATRAITIDAPPEAVWPWIIQMGYRRAGFYSYDLFDNAGYDSADRILPDYQQPQVGDWMPMASKVNDTTAFKVKAFQPNEWLLWEKPGSTWAWELTPLGGDGTRLVVRLKAKHPWRSPGAALLSVFLLEFGDFPMMRKAMKGIKARAEGAGDQGRGMPRRGGRCSST